MTNIIHLSCLMLLLLTCNKVIGKNGTTEAIVPYVDDKFGLHIFDNGYSIKKIYQKLKTDQEIDLRKAKNILRAYFSESEIYILDKNNEHIGTCNTKGWREDRDTRKKVATVQQKLALLEGHTDETTLRDLGMLFPLQEAWVELNQLIKEKKRIDSLTQERIEKLLTRYDNEEKITIFENDKPIGMSHTVGWKADEAAKTRVKGIRQKLRLLEQLNESDRSIEIRNTRNPKKRKAARKK